MSTLLNRTVPVRRDLRVARRFVRSRTTHAGDLGYRIYLVILSLVLGVGPGLWIIGSFFAGLPADAVQVSLRLSIGAAALTALLSLLPRNFAPVVITRQKVFYFVAGPFGARATLSTRTVWLAGVLALGCGAVAAAITTGLALPLWTTISIAAFCGGLAAVACAVLCGAITPQRRFFRAAGVLIGAASAWVLLGSGEAALPVLGIALLFAGIVALSALPGTLGRMPLAELESAAARQELLSAAVYSGDTAGIKDGLAAPVRRFRRLSLPLDGGQPGNAVRAAWLELLRTPGRSACAVGALLGAAVVVGWHGTQVLPLVLALLVSQWAFAAVAKSLRDYLDTVGADRILRQSFTSTVLRHLVFPLLLAMVLAGSGLLIGSSLPGAGSDASAWLLLFLLPAICFFLFSGTSAIPAGALSPVPSASGDLSGVVILFWIFRTVLPAAVLAVLSGPLGIATAAVVVTVVCALGAVQTLRKLAGIERGNRG